MKTQAAVGAGARRVFLLPGDVLAACHVAFQKPPCAVPQVAAGARCGSCPGWGPRARRASLSLSLSLSLPLPLLTLTITSVPQNILACKQRVVKYWHFFSKLLSFKKDHGDPSQQLHRRDLLGPCSRPAGLQESPRPGGTLQGDDSTREREQITHSSDPFRCRSLIRGRFCPKPHCLVTRFTI